VRDAVDHGPVALGRFGLSEAEKGDHTIYVDQEERRTRLNHKWLDVSLKGLKAGVLRTDESRDRLGQGARAEQAGR
jgi:hypothetical protein